MPDIKLIDGRFVPEEAEHILTDLVSIKISFHERKIKTVHESEEEIKHSEKRIKELQEHLRNILMKIKAAPNSRVDIEADIKIGVVPS